MDAPYCHKHEVSHTGTCEEYEERLCPICGKGILLGMSLHNPNVYSCGHEPGRDLKIQEIPRMTANPDDQIPVVPVELMRAARDASWENPGLGELLGEHYEGRPEATTALQRWGDKAMFKAEPIDADEGPKVYLMWMTPDPLGAIAAACKMYKGEVVRDLTEVSDEERREYLAQVQKTKLKAPFEFVKFHFLIEGVTRAFTHQMVRQRTAVYAQESLRFAVVGEEGGTMPVRLPPSLSGVEPWDGEGIPTDAQMRLTTWNETINEMGDAYHRLVEQGVPAEDARGLLPHSVLTRLHYATDLRALLDHAGNRLCTQAQFEWRLVFAKIVEAIRGAHNLNPYMTAPNGKPSSSAVYMANELADLFKPVCYQTGRCEFKANFDRACKIRDRVDYFEREGVPSSEWGTANNLIRIQPAEWLLDPNAARQK